MKDGTLVGAGDLSHLFSERGDYGNVHIRAEARTDGTGAGGIYCRVPEAALTRGNRFPEGFKAMINTFNDPDMTGGLFRALGDDTGGIRAGQPPPKPGEWFTLELIA